MVIIGNCPQRRPLEMYTHHPRRVDHTLIMRFKTATRTTREPNVSWICETALRLRSILEGEPRLHDVTAWRTPSRL